MKPGKAAVSPRFLAAGHESLFLAPCVGGCAMLQWADARERLVVSKEGEGGRGLRRLGKGRDGKRERRRYL